GGGAEVAGVGWDYLHGTALGPDAPARERARWSAVVLRGRLERAVRRLNPDLPHETVERTCDLVRTSTSPLVIEDHRSFHELLLSGVPVAYRDDTGVERHDNARLIDFDQPGRNEFLAVNQLTLVEGGKHRRPDVLLYVNGLPLGQIELKAPGEASDMALAAVNQVSHYRDTVPGLYRFVEVVGVSNYLEARVGTATTPAEHFAEWKTMSDEESERERPQLELMIEGAFSPAHLLDLIRDYVLFETDGARTWKVLAKYHQVHAVEGAIESVARAMDGDRRGGIVWHTQGAGKSYTMVFFVNKLRRDSQFANPTVVAVTDRTDLDNQLADTFTATHLAPACRQAEEITGGSRSLDALLKVPAGGIVFTTIQKFAPPAGTEVMPVLSNRQNVVVIADEAHRSQYAKFAENLTIALPNAARIGFTGTPVEKADRSTRLVFGDYVSVYRMRQAQEDRATVPIYYESRQVPIEVEDPDALRQVEEVLEGEEEAAATKLVTAWAKLEKVVGARDRLERIADEIATHYRARTEVLEGKAMVVAYSRRIAAELTALLRGRLGEEAVDCVVSAQATDLPELSRFRRSKAELKQLARDFRDPDHSLRLVCVKDMWLTGFDAPVLHTLYVDKPMRDHGLLQAIARVNRVFRDKPGGLVVDYIGMGEDLRSSLRAYDEEEIEDPVIPAARAVAGLWEKYEVLAAMLKPAGFRPGELGLAPDPGKLFMDAYNLLLGSERTTREFLDAQAALARWYALARTQPAALELREDVSFFNRLAGELRKVSVAAEQASPEAEQAVRQFFSEGLAAGEIVDIFGIADRDRPEVSVLSDEFLASITERSERPNLQIRLLEKLLRDEVRGRMRSNRLQAKLFSEQLEAALHRYELRQLTSAEVIERLVELAKEMRAARRRHEQLGLSEEEVAFYDALAGGVEDVKADPKLATIAHDLVEGIRTDLTVDWADREATEAKVRAKIKRLLRKHRYRLPRRAMDGGSGGGGPLDLDEAAQLVLEQAKALYRR
ncbi:MAG: type I restriction endonuclease subunit R, partial [Actinomycetota bacterium]|nr:type I restriction endonuclease subunit R [Actinomycetota bacterium]